MIVGYKIKGVPPPFTSIKCECGYEQLYKLYDHIFHRHILWPCNNCELDYIPDAIFMMYDVMGYDDNVTILDIIHEICEEYD